MGMYYSSILISCNLHPYLIMVFLLLVGGGYNQKRGDPIDRPNSLLAGGDLLSDFYRL